MDGLEDLIGQSLEDSGLAERSDTGELVGMSDSPDQDDTQTAALAEGDGAETPAAEVEAKPEEAKPEEKAEEEKPEADETDLELQALGLKGKDDRGVESRIRYSRVKKIWGNYKTKLEKEITERHQQEFEPVKQELETIKARVEPLMNAEKMLDTDPARYFATIGMINPALRQFLNPALFGGQPPQQQQAQTPPPQDDPMPGPNAVFPDGTKGYDMEGIQKLNEWNRRQAEASITAKMEARFGKPIEDFTRQQRETAERNMYEERVKQNIATAQKVYGQAFTEDFGAYGQIKPTSAVLKVMKEQNLGFLEACAVALVPKLHADKNAIRAQVLAELDTAGKNKLAASRPSPAQNQIPGKGAAQTPEEIIAEQMRQHGML